MQHHLSHFPEKNAKSQKYEDWLPSKPHENIAKIIADHIIFSTKETPRTIGIQGKWGSGKSHLIELVIQQLNDSGFHIFKFDAWNYQEEASRKVFLTELLKSLNIKRENGDEIYPACETRDKAVDNTLTQFDKLFAKQVRRNTINKTPLNKNLIIFALAIALVSPFLSAAIYLAKLCNLFSLAPICVMLAFCAAITYAVTNKFKESISLKYLTQFQSINKTPIEINEIYESNNEYSIVDFHNFLNELSFYVNSANTMEKCKIIVVFDNIDRISRDVSITIWKLILNTISNEKNSNMFYLIPFDKDHLNTGYGHKNIKDFLSRVFPIIYKLPEPLNIDIRNYFTEKFNILFNSNTNQDLLSVRTLFLNFTESPTLRDVVIFLNELKLLDSQFDESINLKVKSLYLLIRNQIEKNPLIIIIEKLYFPLLIKSKEDVDKKLENKEQKSTNHVESLVYSTRQKDILQCMFDDNELLQTQIAALHYGIEIKNAEFLPLYQYLKLMIKSIDKTSIDDSTINKVIHHSRFDDIVELLLEEVGIGEIDTLIQFFDLLDKNLQITAKVWGSLMKLKIQNGIYFYDERDSSNILLRKFTSNEPHAKAFLNAIMIQTKELVNVNKGDLYYHACSKLTGLLETLKFNYKPQFDVNSENPSFWKSYISEAGANVNMYINTKNDMGIFISQLLTTVENSLYYSSIDNNYIELDQILVLDNYFKFAKLDKSKLQNFNGKLNSILSKILEHDILTHTYHYWIRIKKTLFKRLKNPSDMNNTFTIDLNYSQINICLSIMINVFNKVHPRYNENYYQFCLENFVDLVCSLIAHDMESIFVLAIEEKYREFPVLALHRDPFAYTHELAEKLLSSRNDFKEAMHKPEEYYINVLSDYVSDLKVFFNSQNDSNDDSRPISYKDMLRDYWYEYMNCKKSTL